jgi:cellulose synthase/poly-beta-1,6-N-acetylglucosamine synthase-like glycosyltransferase
MNQSIDVSVIIVTWNSAGCIAACLHSIYNRTKDRVCEILVVDNASTDETASIVQQQFPSVVFIQTGANLGYAKAVNLGLSRASCRLILLLNPDTILNNDVVGILAGYLDSHPDVGMVAPKLLSPDGEVCVFAARGYPSLRYAVINQFGLRKLYPNNRLHNSDFSIDWNASEPVEVPALGGAAMMLPHAVLAEIGPLRQEGMHQIPVAGVDFNAVVSRYLGQPGALADVPDQALDFLASDLARRLAHHVHHRDFVHQGQKSLQVFTHIGDLAKIPGKPDSPIEYFLVKGPVDSFLDLPFQRNGGG